MYYVIAKFDGVYFDFAENENIQYVFSSMNKMFENFYNDQTLINVEITLIETKPGRTPYSTKQVILSNTKVTKKEE